MTRIIVVGGGAGGLELVTKLGRTLGRKGRAEVTLVDRKASHLWKPLLHEVATGSLDEGVDAISYRAHAKHQPFDFQMGSLEDIDRERKSITLSELKDEHGDLLMPSRELEYDILVLALGSTSNDFNTPGVREHCIFLDSPEQASLFRSEMNNQFLKLHANHGNGKVDIAIVGAGATGVELSAELHNAVKELHNYGFGDLDSSKLNVNLIEAGDRILPALPTRISSAAHQELTQLGVNVRTSTRVTQADENGLVTQNGEKIAAQIMVWAAGIKAPDFIKGIGGLETNRINQLVVTIGQIVVADGRRTKYYSQPYILLFETNDSLSLSYKTFRTMEDARQFEKNPQFELTNSTGKQVNFKIDSVHIGGLQTRQDFASSIKK